MNTEKIWDKYVRWEANRCAKSVSERPAFSRVHSKNEPTGYRPWGMGEVYCPHDKMYIEPCPTCRRSAATARDNLRRLLEIQ